jgi:hypothetical protein
VAVALSGATLKWRAISAFTEKMISSDAVYYVPARMSDSGPIEIAPPQCP